MLPCSLSPIDHAGTGVDVGPFVFGSCQFGKDMRPARVVYVSCNPDALARELPAIGAAGYALTRAHLVDMFPHTEHIEAVVQFDRVRA